MKNSHPKTSLLPSSAHVSLGELQQLRYTAKYYRARHNGISQSALSGSYRSHAVSRGMEFEEVRQYQPGDDIRNIDWRVTARTQVTHSKRYREEKEKPIITAVDQRRSLFFGSAPCFKSVYACHLAALINWITLDKGDRSGGILLSPHGVTETRPVRSHRAVNRWLQQLTTANQALRAIPLVEPPLETLLQQLFHTTSSGTSIYLISDFYDFNDTCEHWLFRLARRHSVTLIWLYDSLEQYLPDSHIINISNGDDTYQLSNTQQTQELFHQRFLQKQARLKDISQRCRSSFYETSTQASPIDVINNGML